MGIRGVLAVLALGAGVPLASQAAVFSETFDSYFAPVGGVNSLAPGTNFGGWTVGGAGVDIVSTQYGGGAWPANGPNSLDLDGAGSIARTLTGLTPGTPYQLTFQFAANQDGLAPVGVPRPFTVTFGTVNQSFGPSSYSTFSTGTLMFTPTAGTTTALLRFVGNDAGPRGAILDDIVVTAVPEPHEWAMMLAGLGLVGWAAKRRREPAAGLPAVA